MPPVFGAELFDFISFKVTLKKYGQNKRILYEKRYVLCQKILNYPNLKVGNSLGRPVV